MVYSDKTYQNTLIHKAIKVFWTQLSARQGYSQWASGGGLYLPGIYQHLPEIL